MYIFSKFFFVGSLSFPIFSFSKLALLINSRLKVISGLLIVENCHILKPNNIKEEC